MKDILLANALMLVVPLAVAPAVGVARVEVAIAAVATVVVEAAAAVIENAIAAVAAVTLLGKSTLICLSVYLH